MRAKGQVYSRTEPSYCMESVMYDKHELRVMLLVVGIIGIGTRIVEAQTNEALRKVADAYWDTRLERSPARATSIGDFRFNDRLEDLSLAGEERWREKLRGFVSALESIPNAKLSADDALTRDILERTIRDELLVLECGQSYTPIDPLDGPQVRFPLILVSQPFRDVADFRAYVARLEAFPKQIDDVIANLREGVSKGIVAPRVLIEKSLPQIRMHIVKDASQSEFWKPLNDERAKRLSKPDFDEISASIEKAIRLHVVGSYEKLLAFVQGEYLPKCRSTVGIGAVPGGKEAYEKLAFVNMTVKIDPEKVHELGLSEVKRLRDEMSKVQREMGIDGSLDDFIKKMRTDPAQRFKSGEELFSAADVILQRAKSQMPKLFGRLPKADCVMKETEAFRAAASPVAYYNGPAEDGSRPGYYYINLYKPEERLRFTLEALSYHEAVPGHHLQVALHQEMKDLPKFRRYGWFTAYGEGWALYTEKLGYEIGGYADAASRYGQLTFEMWRACRLVVDTGMHHKGWSRQQAIDYMTANTSLAPLDIESEIDRYISWPGQALAYKVGELRILQLRKDAERELGAKFDLKAFHDAILKDGSMPIDMLERRMQEWMKTQPHS